MDARTRNPKKGNMKLIADSGSTKTDWCLTDGSNVVWQHQTQGINPVHQKEETVKSILVKELYGNLSPHEQDVTEVYFYGAGCDEGHADDIRKILTGIFPHIAECEVNGDMLAAARALCGNKEGVACILGTGANSCLFNGNTIVANVPPLGYILGDEGSGAVLGKRFLNGIFKGSLPSELRDLFLQDSGLSYLEIIRKVYQEPMANRFLASLSLFIGKHLGDYPALESLLVDHFRDFIQKNVARYERQELPIHAVGSIAWHYRKQLEQAARTEGYTLGTVLKSPMEGLLAFHGHACS